MNMNNLTYIRYSRKSSEKKERQALSIHDQNKECDDLSFREGLKVKYRLEEAKTAFKPNKREQFSLMVELVKSGKANAILTWKPDRICRNPLEGGIVLQLLQDGILKEIRTPLGDIYTPDSDHLILQIHFGMANQYSRNLSQNVRRGLTRKVQDRKEYPRRAPLI
jgi:DNA invertase Pin-like site-specific DNA recombinase